MNAQTILIKLADELRLFGLNPLEWIIQKKTGNLFEITNRFDRDFVLVGQLEYFKNSPRWAHVELAT